MNDTEFEIFFSSIPEYEKLAVEIFCDGKFVALINQDEGIDFLKIEFPGSVVREEAVLRKLDLSLFERALETAKQKIIDNDRRLNP